MRGVWRHMRERSVEAHECERCGGVCVRGVEVHECERGVEAYVCEGCGGA